MPRLSEDFAYPPVDPATVTLSSGTPYSAHADDVNAWNQSAFQDLTDKCVRAGRQCGPVTGPVK